MNKFLKQVEKESALNDFDKIIIKDTHFEKISFDYAIDFVNSLNRNREKSQIGFLTGKFVMGDIFEALAEQYNFKFNHLIVSSLSMNENNVDSFKNLFDMKCIDKLTLIVSDFWYSHAKHNLYKYFVEVLGDFDVELVIAKTHAKIYLINNGVDFISITTSANLNSCNNIEQYEFSFNKEKYNFYENILLKIRDQFYLDNEKMLSHKKLWEVVKDGER